MSGPRLAAVVSCFRDKGPTNPRPRAMGPVGLSGFGGSCWHLKSVAVVGQAAWQPGCLHSTGLAPMVDGSDPGDFFADSWGNDQSAAKLRRDCEDNGICLDKDKWFIAKRVYQSNHSMAFIEWTKEYNPSLVVVDSIGSCSTRMQVQEKDKAFASPFYQIGEVNGDLERGFPATTFIWIHHDNASGEARGTRYLPAAIDEQWHLRKLLDTEVEQVRSQGMKPGYCRFIQIKKSRLGREGDRIVVERDVDYAYNVYDYTPTERLEDEGTGDPEPPTMALRIVRDAVVEQRGGEGGDVLGGIIATDVWEQLCAELTGQGRDPVSRRSVVRWLNRWVEDGILLKGKFILVVRKRTTTFTIPYDKKKAENLAALLSFCDQPAAPAAKKPAEVAPVVPKPERDADDWAADQEEDW